MFAGTSPPLALVFVWRFSGSAGNRVHAPPTAYATTWRKKPVFKRLVKVVTKLSSMALLRSEATVDTLSSMVAWARVHRKWWLDADQVLHAGPGRDVPFDNRTAMCS